MKKTELCFIVRGGRGLRLDKRGVFVVFVPLKLKLDLWGKDVKGAWVGDKTSMQEFVTGAGVY